jgi:hypothetical protein
MEQETKVKAAADLIVELGKEVEAPGNAATDEASLVQARAVLRLWVDGVKGVVVNPAMGRVTVIHESGQASSIASSDLAFRLSAAGITQSG